MGRNVTIKPNGLLFIVFSFGLSFRWPINDLISYVLSVLAQLNIQSRAVIIYHCEEINWQHFNLMLHRLSNV